MFKLNLEKSEEPDIQVDHGETKRENIYFCFIDCQSPWLCGLKKKKRKPQWKNLQKIEIPDHLTCLLRNLYAGQAATVITGHGPTDWFQIGNEYVKLSDTTERLN